MTIIKIKRAGLFRAAKILSLDVIISIEIHKVRKIKGKDKKSKNIKLFRERKEIGIKGEHNNIEIDIDAKIINEKSHMFFRGAMNESGRINENKISFSIY